MAIASGDNQAAPPELRLFWMCQRFDSLPEPGGLFDQDAGLMERMSALGAAHEAVSHMRSLKGAEIHNMNPGAGRVIMWLESQGVQV